MIQNQKPQGESRLRLKDRSERKESLLKSTCGRRAQNRIFRGVSGYHIFRASFFILDNDARILSERITRVKKLSLNFEHAIEYFL